LLIKKLVPNLTATQVQLLAVMAGVGVTYFFYREGKKAAAAVGDAFTPTSQTNIFHRGTNAVGSALTGNSNFSLGSWVYDLFNDDFDPNG